MTNIMSNETTMYKALLERDSEYEGVFFVGVKTTGIFCRPTCHARKPKATNVEFFPNAREALEKGYHRCKKCHPLSFRGEFPVWLKTLILELDRLSIDRRMIELQLYGFRKVFGYSLLSGDAINRVST